MSHWELSCGKKVRGATLGQLGLWNPRKFSKPVWQSCFESCLLSHSAPLSNEVHNTSLPWLLIKLNPVRQAQSFTGSLWWCNKIHDLEVRSSGLTRICRPVLVTAVTSKLTSGINLVSWFLWMNPEIQVASMHQPSWGQRVDRKESSVKRVPCFPHSDEFNPHENPERCHIS